MKRLFSQDYTNRQTDVWQRTISRFAGQPGIQAIEIGCFEGRSSLWFLENILTHPTSSLTCIDHACPPCFRSNLDAHFHKVRWMQELSGIALRDRGLAREAYHFIYIDGGHTAAEVLEDAILAFPLLAPGGILLFDDYRWQSNTPELPHTMPKLGINSFLAVFSSRLKILNIGYQMVVEKVSEAAAP